MNMKKLIMAMSMLVAVEFPVLAGSSATLSLPVAGGTATANLSFSTGGIYQFQGSSHPAWITSIGLTVKMGGSTISLGSGNSSIPISSGATATLTFTASANTTGSSRSWDYVVDGPNTATITVTQPAQSGGGGGKPNFTFYAPSDWPASAFTTTSDSSTKKVTQFTKGATVYLRYAVVNGGTATASGSVDVSVAMDGGKGNVVTIPDPLKAGAGRYMGGTINTAKLSDGAHTVTIAINPSKTIAESSYSDNVQTLTFTVVSASDPKPQVLKFGPGEASEFMVSATERATVVGVSSLVWSDFAKREYKGQKNEAGGSVGKFYSFDDSRIVDAEKNAKIENSDYRDTDDYWCMNFSFLDALFWGGYMKGYATEDEIADSFRKKKNADSIFEVSFVGWDSGCVNYSTFVQDQTGFAAELEREFARADELLVMGVTFDESFVWKGMAGVSHGVVCCGYSFDATKSNVNDPKILKGLYIIDPDNDMFNAGGAGSAPDSITYCPVTWDANRKVYRISNVFGATGEVDLFGGAYVQSKVPAATVHKTRDTTIPGGSDGLKLTVKPNSTKYGSVSGGGTYEAGKLVQLKATAKDGYVFTGWFTDSKCTIPLGVTGCDYREKSVRYAMPARDKNVYAKFVTKAEDKSALKFTSATKALATTPAKMTSGSKQTLALGFASASLPTVTATGLPPGMSIDKRMGVVSGKPTKPGKYVAKVTVKTAAGNKITQKVRIDVKAPVGFYGTFDGYALVGTTPAYVTFTSDAYGKVSGKVTYKGKGYKFTSSYAASTATASKFTPAIKIGTKTYRPVTYVKLPSIGTTVVSQANGAASGFVWVAQKGPGFVKKGKALSELVGRAFSFKSGYAGAWLTGSKDVLKVKFVEWDAVLVTGTARGKKVSFSAPVLYCRKVSKDGNQLYTIQMPLVEPTAKYYRLLTFKVTVDPNGHVVSVGPTFDKIK